MGISFALPGCRSRFSLLWGTASPAELVEAADRAGIKHLGLADSDNLYGAVDFYFACRDRGINPLLGVRLTTVPGNLHLIAQDYAGYQNLCRLVSARRLEGKVDRADLQEHQAALFCLASPQGDLETLREIFGEKLFLGLNGNEDSGAASIINRFSIPTAADPEISFVHLEDFSLHKLLRAIDGGGMIEDLNGIPRAALDDHFVDPAVWKRRFAARPEAVTNSLKIAESCHLFLPEGRHLLPCYPGENGRDKAGILREKALAGLQSQKNHIPASYQARLDFELEIMGRTGFVDYFLVVSDIVDFCRASGIPAVGRGSAAGSLVAHALGDNTG